MSNIYNKIENDILNLDNINSWNDKINKIKDIKQNISDEQKKLNELINKVLQNNQDYQVNKKKKYDLDTLISEFNNSNDIQTKIELYHLISYTIDNIEKQLFS